MPTIIIVLDQLERRQAAMCCSTLKATFSPNIGGQTSGNTVPTSATDGAVAMPASSPAARHWSEYHVSLEYETYKRSQTSRKTDRYVK